MSRDVMIVAGMASKGSNLAPLSLLAKLHIEDTVHFIDGASMQDGSLTVSTPSQQLDEIHAIAEHSPNEEVVMYSQSLGALALIRYIEEPLHTTATAIAIAPPLPDPFEVQSSTRIAKRLRGDNGRLTIPSYSFALGESGPSAITPEPVDICMNLGYLDDIAMHATNINHRVQKLCESNILKLVIPDHDWNTQLLELVGKLPNTIPIDGTHSLHDTEEKMAYNAAFIYSLSQSSGLIT